ncbi:amidohydrolase [Lacimicrobium sp. SS2-24]|uniref:amidohydrolase n=1 Tax=Lacimicrobium sp. SS2-24 TaxID=2005569 RepID=UPI001AEF51E5|nr:amidohydrolase [Lacimicrobium sp. SS2-24]
MKTQQRLNRVIETGKTSCGRIVSALVALLFTASVAASSSLTEADMVITGADIWTADADMPRAAALAVRGEHILAVGSEKRIAAYIGDRTRVIDANGATVLPGFIDSHVHFLIGGMGLSSVQLRSAQTPEEFRQRIGEFASAQPKGQWILNGEWDHENWGGELPSRQWIDAVTPDHPVFVMRLDGHMALANSLALEMAGVKRDTPAVTGGEIVRDEQGRPTGVLKDNAMNLVQAVIPEPDEAQLDAALQAASKHVASFGITSVHDMGDWQSMRSLRTYQRAHKKGELKTRIYAVEPLQTWRKVADYVAEHGRGDHWLKVGGVKGFMDGSLGSHTAAFYQPYTDTPDDRGFFINSPAQMQSWIRSANQAGLQLMVHAIGDRAIGSLLDIYAAIQSEQGPADRRWRIEHAQHIHPDDLERFASLNVIASMQPYHAIDDGRWAERVIGSKRARTTYAFNDLLQEKARLAFGSDWFVAPVSPIMGIYAALTRRTLDGQHLDGWVPEQKISLEHALSAYTIDAAYASAEEDIKGSLTPGKLADITVLDKNLFRIAPQDMDEVKVRHTIVGGVSVYPQRD